MELVLSQIVGVAIYVFEIISPFQHLTNERARPISASISACQMGLFEHGNPQFQCIIISFLIFYSRFIGISGRGPDFRHTHKNHIKLVLYIPHDISIIPPIHIHTHRYI